MSIFSKNSVCCFLVFVACFFCALPLTRADVLNRGNPQLEYYGESIDQMIYKFMKERNIPGLSMSIVQAPYIPRVASYGKANVEKKLLASSKTMWNIGPLTQGFTAVAVMQLVETDKLHLEDSVDQYLKGLPDSWRKLTIKQLIQHATGLADYRSSTNYDASQTYAPSQLLDMVRPLKLEFSPGSRVEVSATNFLLLGMLIEKASGSSLHDYIWQGQILPLGLQHTMFVEDFAKLARQDTVEDNQLRHRRFLREAAFIDPTEPATGYVRGTDSVSHLASSNQFGFGSIWSSAEDISRWDIALAGEVLIKDKKNREFIYKPTMIDGGLVVPGVAGWQFTGHQGFMDVKGSAPGFSAYLSRFTDHDDLVCVTLLANVEGVDFTPLARQIAAAYDRSLGAEIDPVWQKTYESNFDAAETTARLVRNIEAKGNTVFANLDQQAYAQRVGLDLRPTHLIIFGQPKAGTKLMQESAAVSLSLPLRVAVWTDSKNRTWIGYNDILDVAKQSGIKHSKLIEQMANTLSEIVRKSANLY